MARAQRRTAMRAESRPAAALVRHPGPAVGSRAFLANADRPMVAATYWFDPAEAGLSGPVVVRFTGHRSGVGARTRAGDQFVQDELIEDVPPRGGPISVTTRVRGINAGEWIVNATVLPGPARGPRERPPRLYPGGWSWARWSLRKHDGPLVVRTCLEPFAPVPGVVPLSWAALAVIGFTVALATQQAILARLGVPAAQSLLISGVAIGAGLLGSQAKFAYDHRRERRFLGWAVQGFLIGATVAGVAALTVAQVPLGPFLDANVPGIFLGLAVGRLGCFFAGCCGGRPTASRWGVWSSDQRIGARRIPTQLFESLLSLAVALGALGAIWAGAPLRGALFVGGVAAYTLVRQRILSLRVEASPGARGSALTAAAAAAVLVADLAYLFFWPG